MDYFQTMIHWPVRMKKGSIGISLENFILTDMPNTWGAMEALYDSGEARAIGVSNFLTKKLADLLAIARIPPAVDQVECNPSWQQSKLRAFCKEKGIHLSAPNRCAPSEELFTDAESPFSGAHHEENLVEPIMYEESHASNKSLDTQIDNGISRGISNRQVQLLPQHHPKAIDQEIQQISRNSNYVVIPLFEKPLSDRDANHKSPRLVKPKRCAEVMHEGLKHQRHHGHFVQPDKAPPFLALLESDPAFF